MPLATASRYPVRNSRICRRSDDAFNISGALPGGQCHPGDGLGGRVGSLNAHANDVAVDLSCDLQVGAVLFNPSVVSPDIADAVIIIELDGSACVVGLNGVNAGAGH